MGLERAIGKPDAGGAVRRVLEGLIRLVYPPSCMACGIFVDQPGALCPACWAGLHFIEHPLCPVLGVPFAHAAEEGMVSPAAMADPPDFTRARAVVLYDDVARLLVHRLKYKDRTDLALAMARWMVRASDGLLEEADLVLPVPLHRRRLLWRRYNQSAELARAICRLSGRPYGPDVLVRRRATRQQVGLSATARQANVRGAFAVRLEQKPMLAGRRILLVDDVLTTGATVNAAARVLRRAGAVSVDVLTFARVAEPAHPG